MTLPYAAPIEGQLQALALTRSLHLPPPIAAWDANAIRPILDQSGRLATRLFAPLNAIGDRHGATLEQDGVRTPPGFDTAYREWIDGEWAGIGADPDDGGLGLPFAVTLAVMEHLTSANMAFSLCTLLSQGAIHAITSHGTAEQRRIWLPGLISGHWTGTMNLTEPQAGSDVGALQTQAKAHADGSYRIRGHKIFISWGDHDLADNIVHLVLARLPGAPPGSRGISLFIVPKFLVDRGGKPGEPNDVRCVALEHKLGIHASPTCQLIFGEADRCVGYLLGEPHRGLAAMFTMMNHARIGIGLQGVAMGERALQAAEAYARIRCQSALPGAGGQPVTIEHHPDIQRMLTEMRAAVAGCRLLAYWNAAAVDAARDAGTAADRDEARHLADLLTPITKAFVSDMGVEVSSLAIQIHGGAGYIEESGVAQFYRDARIAPIYEGTNGIQALDLVNRKLLQDGGRHWRTLSTAMREWLRKCQTADQLRPAVDRVYSAVDALHAATIWIAARAGTLEAAAVATPYLRAFGQVMAGYLLCRQAADDRLRSDNIRLAAYHSAATIPAAISTLQSLADVTGPILARSSAP